MCGNFTMKISYRTAAYNTTQKMCFTTACHMTVYYREVLMGSHLMLLRYKGEIIIKNRNWIEIIEEQN